MDETLAVAVCSPQAVVKAGFETLLGHHPDKFRIVQPHGGPEGEDPDVVLYDVLALLEGTSTEFVRLVEQTHSKVLAIGRDLRPDLTSRALTAGANGFFSLGITEDQLVAAVESAGTGWKEGDPGEDPTVGSSESAARANQLGTDVGLTPREVMIFELVAQGRSNQEIAEILFISVNSVKTYIRNAYRKVPVGNRAQAVGWALRHGFGTEQADSKLNQTGVKGPGPGYPAPPPRNRR